jgi:general secretion pathway protein J
MKVAPQSGFTLLEATIAIALLAMVSLMGVQFLQSMINSSTNNHLHSKRLGDLQRAFTLLEKDLTHAFVHPSAPWGLNVQFRAAEGSLLLLRRNYLNPGSQLPRSSLERVEWELNDKQQLSRKGFSPLTSDWVATTTLFEEVVRFSMRYWINGRWQREWFASATLPEAIEVTIETIEFGEVKRIFLIPGVGMT